MNNDKKKIAEDFSLPASIRSVVRMYPSNQINRLYYGGLPHIGNALWGSWRSDRVQKTADAYENYSLSTNLLIDGFSRPIKDKIRLGGGSPALFMFYNRCLDSIKDALNNKAWSQYPMAAGDALDKVPIIKYFEKKYLKTIDEDNIIFTHSSTQAFTFAMEAILDYGDVILMTAPNYGLFTFIPERVGGKVHFLNLEANDDWKINPKKLKEAIEAINLELKSDYDRNRGKYVFRRSDTCPKVSAFVNYNPHNPTGVVYGIENRALLLEISYICKELGVFIIDDLAYSGLEYDRDNTALPICSLDGHFDNTITLYTLSKSYGMAGIRSGVIIGNKIVTSLIRDRIFQMLDSLSSLQSSAISEIFQSNQDSEREREEYLSRITKEYYDRYIFVKAIIGGFDNLNQGEQKKANLILKNNKIDQSDVDMTGIQGVEIIIEPESGFFILLNLSSIIGKTYKSFKIIDDKTLLQFLYTSENIKVLTGDAFCWNNSNQLVIRTTTALSYTDLIDGFLRLKKAISQLK